MKAILVALLLVITISSVVSQTSRTGGFNQTLFVYPNETTDYSLFSFITTSVLDVIVSSSLAVAQQSSVVVSSFATLPTVNVNVYANATVNGGFPVGYAAFSAGAGPISIGNVIGAGISIYVSSDISGKGNTNVTLLMSSAVSASLNSSILLNFRPLAFNAAANGFYELPPSQYSATPNGGIAIYTNASITLVFAVLNPVPVVLNIANNAIVSANIVANKSVNFVINEGTRTALYIYNLTAAAGTVTVAVATNVSTSTVASGQVLVSNLYRFTHSAGGDYVYNAQLTFDASQSGINLNAGLTANLAWYLYTNGGWVKQSSSVSGTVVTSVANHFSDWSVQTSNSTASGSTTAGTTNNGGSGTTGSASKINSFFGGFLKCLF